MTIEVQTKQRWAIGSYLTIRSARHENGVLRVSFADGEEVAVPIHLLASPPLVAPDWSSVSTGPLWITVPTANGDVEISWLAIRLLTDPEFRSYWEDRSQDDEHSNALRRE
jgi:hypothetical protein